MKARIYATKSGKTISLRGKFNKVTIKVIGSAVINKQVKKSIKHTPKKLTFLEMFVVISKRIEEGFSYSKKYLVSKLGELQGLKLYSLIKEKRQEIHYASWSIKDCFESTKQFIKELFENRSILEFGC